MDAPAVLHNIVLSLQRDPKLYKCFGIWWWPVKALLKARYTTEQLYLLGEYQDEAQAQAVPRLDLADTLQAALEEYALNLRYNLGRDAVQTPDGETVSIRDEDAGL